MLHYVAIFKNEDMYTVVEMPDEFIDPDNGGDSALAWADKCGFVGDASFLGMYLRVGGQ